MSPRFCRLSRNWNLLVPLEVLMSVSYVYQTSIGWWHDTLAGGATTASDVQATASASRLSSTCATRGFCFWNTWIFGAVKVCLSGTGTALGVSAWNLWHNSTRSMGIFYRLGCLTSLEGWQARMDLGLLEVYRFGWPARPAGWECFVGQKVSVC